MSIPLVQEATKDAINTSIIAIKRNIERINMLLGLSNSEEIDTSEFVKKSDIVDEVAIGNMQSVSSNAVAEAFNGFEVEEYGKIGTNGYYVKYANGLMEQYEEKTFPNVTLQSSSGVYMYSGMSVSLTKAYKTGTTPIDVEIHLSVIYGITPRIWIGSGNNGTENNNTVVFDVFSDYPYGLNGTKYFLHTKGWWK